MRDSVLACRVAVELAVFVHRVAGCEPLALVRRQPDSSALARSLPARRGRIGERRRIQHCSGHIRLDYKSSGADTGPAGRLSALSGVRNSALMDRRQPAEGVLAGSAVVPVVAAAGATAEAAAAAAAVADVVAAAGVDRLRCADVDSNTVSVDLFRGAFCSLGRRRYSLPDSPRWPAVGVGAEWPYASVLVATAEPVAGAAIA